MRPRELLQPPAFQISLRIRHPSVDPAAISRELKLPAAHSFKAGEPRNSESGIAATHAESYWLAAIDPASWLGPELSSHPNPESGGRYAHEYLARNLGAAVGICATHLRRHEPFIRKLQSEGGQVSLRIELSPTEVGSFALTPEILRLLGELTFSMELDFAEHD
jgi:hypothetical protein